MNSDSTPWLEPDDDAWASGDDGPARDKARGKKRTPRKMTAKRLHNIALAYLDRYEASEAGFRAVLGRRIYKAALAHNEDPASFESMIDDEVAKATQAGFIDNKRFAENQVRLQRGRGASARAIQARLKSKGVQEEFISDALDSDERDDAQAAWRYARRRRLGPYRLRDRAERRERDIAALCRSGFSFSLAAKVVDGQAEDGTP
ncbi:MAG: regulatory protein RecX [Devosiaceae bacterium]